MSLPTSGLEVHLVARPRGEPTPADFAVVQAPLAELADGQVLVQNTFMSVDPYMRGRMNDVKSYVPPFALGAVMDGGAVGTVLASKSAKLAVGDQVLSQLGWRQYAVADAALVRKIDASGVSPSAYLGILGMPGLTAYAGLLEIAQMRAGDVVFVSGAAGAVGSIAGQIARRRGASRVIGSAGSDAKVNHLLHDLGFDAAFNYKKGPVAEQLRVAAPDGIDVYFDNVGGDHLEAAIGAMRNHGRIALCGAISQYNAEVPAPGPRNLAALAVGRRLTLRGFIVSDHNGLFKPFLAEVGGWLKDGQVKVDETVFEGIERAVDAFIGLLHGENTGKMVVKLA